MWGKCGENPLASHDFSHVFRCRFGFQVPALVSCEKRSEIRDCTQLLPNKTGLSATTTMAYSQYYYPVAVTLSVSICGKI